MISKNSEITSWVKLYTKELLKYTLYKTSDLEVSENIVQDTFEAVIKSYESYKRESNPKTWIYSILNNKIKDYYKSKKNQFVSLDDFHKKDAHEHFDEDDGWKKESAPKDWLDDNSSNILDNDEFVSIFQKCIEHLPENWRECIKMKYIFNVKGTEICQMLSISQANFWQILHRAKLDLRKCLEINWFAV